MEFFLLEKKTGKAMVVEQFDNSTGGGLSMTELFDTGITDLTNYIIETLRFVVSLIIGGLVVVLLGKLISIMLTTPAVVTVDDTIDIPAANVVEKSQMKMIIKETTIDGWSSECMNVPDTTTLPVRKIVKQLAKGLRRKAISVGPVMLTPNSHLKRSINVEDREERYHYDIVPPVPLDDDEPLDDAPENVCVFVAIIIFLFVT